MYLRSHLNCRVLPCSTIYEQVDASNLIPDFLQDKEGSHRTCSRALAVWKQTRQLIVVKSHCRMSLCLLLLCQIISLVMLYKSYSSIWHLQHTPLAKGTVHRKSLLLLNPGEVAWSQTCTLDCRVALKSSLPSGSNPNCRAPVSMCGQPAGHRSCIRTAVGEHNAILM